MTSLSSNARTEQPASGLTAPSRVALFLAFFAIYVVWGSTYLAIRYAVETIPPLVVAGLRRSGAPAWFWAFFTSF